MAASVAPAAPAAAKAVPAAASLDPWQLIVNAGPVVMTVLLVLLVASVLCWAIIVAKAGMLAGARTSSRRFLKLLERGDDDAAARLDAELASSSPHARIWAAARREMEARPPEAGAPGSRGKDADEGPIRRMERTLSRVVDGEITRMESWLGILATIGSTSPFVGLFGTVWGIMSSFLAIGAQESATLAVVAPGIAEALIATAAGLFAAIPAVVGYNFLVRRVRVWNEDLAAFAAQLVNDADAGLLRPAAASASPSQAGQQPQPGQGTSPQFRIRG